MEFVTMSRISFLQMKKFILIAIVLGCFSCIKKKDWNCTCEVTGNNFGTFTKTIPHQTQNKANTECSDYGKQLMGSNGTYKCKLTGA